MPVKIAENLPAKGILESENIFVMGEERASHQDIRPLKIVIMNIMPTKISTETQLLRVLGNTSLQIDVSFMHPISHTSKNTPIEHLRSFYQYFDEIKQQRFDGMIVTGAPVELLPFEEVDYWKELTEIMDWAKKNVFSTFYICWGAQAGLYHFYDIPKYPLPQKMFGVFPHTIKQQHVKLLRGFDDVINAPHSRHTEIRREDIEQCSDLDILVESEEAGIYIVASIDGRQIFVTGHSEYDPLTLKAEYDRDIAKGLDIQVPRNYYPNDDPTREPLVTWRAHANLLYSNWLNYYVYQETPFDLNELQ